MLDSAHLTTVRLGQRGHELMLTEGLEELYTIIIINIIRT